MKKLLIITLSLITMSILIPNQLNAQVIVVNPDKQSLEEQYAEKMAQLDKSIDILIYCGYEMPRSISVFYYKLPRKLSAETNVKRTIKMMKTIIRLEQNIIRGHKAMDPYTKLLTQAIEILEAYETKK